MFKDDIKYSTLPSLVQTLVNALKSGSYVEDEIFNIEGETESRQIIGKISLIQMLAEALKEDNSITHLDLSHNNIGTQGAIALAEALKENNSIIYINLDTNNIGDIGAAALAEALKINQNIIHIDLSVIDIGTDEKKALADALKANYIIISDGEPPKLYQDAISCIGYLISASITPGIVCIKDIVNGKSVDDNCYSYYASSLKADNLVELVTKALISNLIFTTANHDLRCNFVNSIIFSKAAADTIFSVIMII